MKSRIIRLSICAFLMGVLSSCSLHRRQSAGVDYLFAYFSEESPGLRWAHSSDGYKWREVSEKESAYIPQVGGGAFRDPSIARGPDGIFHMVWTSTEDAFGYARSKDLIHWEDERLISVPLRQKLRATWAPEVFYDRSNDKFIVAWSSATKTIPGLRNHFKGNFKIYVSETKDFQTWSPARLLIQPDPSVFMIDATFLHEAETYFVILKVEAHNEIDGEKDGLHLTRATSLKGPFRRLSATLDRATGDAEGPTILALKDHWIAYYDTGYGRRGALRTNDLKIWFDISDAIRLPDNFRHGSAFAVETDLARRLQVALRR